MTFETPARAILAAWRDALRDSALDTTAKAVGFVLSTYFSRDGSGAFASRKTIAAGASLRSERAVYAAVRRLEAAGFLTVSVSKGRSSNSYAATLPTEHPRTRLEPSTPEHGSATDRASGDAQPCTEEASTVHPRSHESVESDESGAHALDNLTRDDRWWLDNVGAEYAHDAPSFVAETTKRLKIGKAAAEQIRLALLEKEAA